MSQAPRTTKDKRAIDRYRSAWQATMKLLREGRSFSGRERNCVFLNTTGPRFANVSAISGLDFLDDGRALAVTDWDHDGDLDIWLSNRTGPRLRFMRNETISRQVPSDANFVAFRLQGTKSNRDAIGARVEVRLADRSAGKLMQTLYAGDAYLSQSSKWLHFGLGRQSVIEEVHVRWPNGQSEIFSEIRPGKRFRLVEGTGVAIEVRKMRVASVLTPSTQPSVKPSGVGRTFLSNRIPMPILRYEAWNGSRTEMIATDQRPLLVCFWASWCAPCITELKALRDHAEQLRGAGLDVLALSVDGLDRDKPTQPQEASSLLATLQFPFPSGVAQREALDKLAIVESIVFNRQQPLAVPISFLLDAHGALAAVYRGPVQLPVLLADIGNLAATHRERRDLAIPLAGRWISPPRHLLLRGVARAFQRRGYTEDYARYLGMEANFLKRQRAHATTNRLRKEWDEQYASAHFNAGLALASSGDWQEAMEHFRRTVAVQPGHVEACINLGALMAKNNQLDAAVEWLRRAVRLEPNSLPARTNLGAALGSRGELAEAIEHYRHILSIQSDAAPVHARLALWLLETEEVVEAAEHLEQAIRLNPRDVRSKLSLAWLRATYPVEAIRDAEQAVRLALQLRTLSGGKDARVLDVLSTAYAEQENYPAARQALTRALEQLGTQQQTLKTGMLRRMKGYEANKPHRDKDGKYP